MTNTEKQQITAIACSPFLAKKGALDFKMRNKDSEYQ